MADGGTWQNAKIPPYKHAIVPYSATMVGLPSQIAYGGWQKICHAIPPWRRHGRYLTTLSSNGNKQACALSSRVYAQKETCTSNITVKYILLWED